MPQAAVVPRTIDLDTYRTITESVPAMLWLGDVSGRCVFLNRAQREFWGVSVVDIADFDWTATVHPDDFSAMAEPYMAAMEAREPFEVEARYRRADGAWRVLRTTASPRYDPGGGFSGMTGVNHDVTEQREAEADLRHSTEQLRHALEASQGMGTFVWDIPEDRLHVDPNFAAAHGVDPEAAPAGSSIEPYFAAIAEEDLAETRALLHRVLSEGGPFTNEYRIRLPGQPVRWLHSRGSCDVENGEVVRVSGVVLDITERKEQEERLSLLTRELAHRIKNIFAVVRAMTAMAARNEPAAHEPLTRLGQRFAAMALAYAEVTPSPGNGGPEATRFGALFDTLVAPFRSNGDDRVALDGDDLHLTPHAASSLALIFHEMATNSAKYGALSGDGRVRVAVERVGSEVVFTWTETGGPEIPAAPEKTGFGWQLIRASVSNLGGTSEAEWHRHGLDWRLRVPEGALTCS